MVCALDRIHGVAAFNHKGLDLGITECKLADHVDILADDHTGHACALIEHTLGQHRCVDGKLLQRFTIGEGVGAVLDLLGCNVHSSQLLATSESVLANGQQRVGQCNGFNLVTACEGVVGNDTDGLKFQVALQGTALEGVLADDLQVILTAEGDLLQAGAAQECTVLNGLQRRGQHHLFQCGQVCKGVGIDLLNTLGQHHLGDGVVTDVPGLGGLGIVKGQLFLGLHDVLEVGEGEVANFSQAQILGHGYETA